MIRSKKSLKRLEQLEKERLETSRALATLRIILRHKKQRTKFKKLITLDALMQERLTYSISNQIIRIRKELRDLTKLERKRILHDDKVADKIPGLNTARVHYGK